MCLHFDKDSILRAPPIFGSTNQSLFIFFFCQYNKFRKFSFDVFVCGVSILWAVDIWLNDSVNGLSWWIDKINEPSWIHFRCEVLYTLFFRACVSVCVFILSVVWFWTCACEVSWAVCNVFIPYHYRPLKTLATLRTILFFCWKFDFPLWAHSVFVTDFRH